MTVIVSFFFEQIVKKHGKRKAKKQKMGGISFLFHYLSSTHSSCLLFLWLNNEQESSELLLRLEE